MDYFDSWRRWIRPLCLTMYFICVIVAFPMCLIELTKHDAPGYVQAWFIGGIFVMMSVPISLWDILQHLVYYSQPKLQRHIIRILWMVPIYALNAWFALRFSSIAIYLDTVRECYEAYVIYNFMRYLINFLCQEHTELEALLASKRHIRHFIPCCCLSTWPSGRVFLNRCKHGVLQYTIVRPTMTLLALFFEYYGTYDEGNLNFTSAWSFIVVFNNMSQLWAMYCLVLFYKATKDELAPIRPIPKFLCVKAVVFLSFWQSTVIAVLAKLGVIPVNGTWYHSVEEAAIGLQDFVICIEMFFAAIAHHYSFSYIPFTTSPMEQTDLCSSFFSMWDVRDMRDDVIDHAHYIGHGLQNRLNLSNHGMVNSIELVPLISHNAPDFNYSSESSIVPESTKVMFWKNSLSNTGNNMVGTTDPINPES